MWWRLAAHLERNLTKQNAALLAVTTWFLVEEVDWLQRRKQDEWSSSSSLANSQTTTRLHLSSPSFMPLSVTMTACDLMFMPPSKETRGKLKRVQTIQLLEELKTEDSVDTKYKIQWNNPIGSGSFGSVFYGTDRASGERVAIKKISKRFTSSATFQQEIQALLKTRAVGRHPNICGLREHFDHYDFYYLVLDLVEGSEMFDNLCEEGAYSEADAARLTRQVASALAFLHGIGLVHADMKPENLLFSSKKTQDANIKVIDFGSARFVTDKGKYNHKDFGTSSTQAYCPPEVLAVYRKKRVRIDPSYDMWSLGVILYVMLTGVHPFDLDGDSSDKEIEEHILSGKPPLRNSSYTQHLSNDAISLMEGLLNFDPEKRWTATDVLENSWVRGETASSKKIPESDKRLATYRRHKTRIGSNFFLSMLAHSDAHGGSDEAQRTSLLEGAFRQLDAHNRGYVSTNELCGDSSASLEEDGELSFAEMADLLSEHMTNKYFKKGHILYNEGEQGDYMYFVNSGSVQVANAEGFIKTRKAGEFFGEEALMHQDQKYDNTVTCATPVHLIRIAREFYEKYVNAHQQVELTMAETGRLRQRERANTILGLQSTNMEQKIYQNGDVIFEKGSEGSVLHILEEGNVDLLVGDGLKVRSLRSGEMMGEHAAFYKHKNYNVTAQCVSDSCKTRQLHHNDIRRLFRKNTLLRENFHDIILRRDFKKAVCTATKRPFPQTGEDARTVFDMLDNP